MLVGETALAKHLEEASLGDIDDGNAVLIGSVLASGLLTDEGPLS